MIDRQALEIFIYEGYKDAFGVKGRHYNFDAMTDEALVQEAEWIEREMAFAFDAEEKAAALAVEQFKLRVAGTIRLGAGDRKTALRWMFSAPKPQHIQDIEHWVWEHGILFTDYGRNLVKEVEALVDLKW